MTSTSARPPSPPIRDLVPTLDRLDGAFLRLRRWMHNPPPTHQLSELARGLDDGHGDRVDPAKIAACEAVAHLRTEGPVTVKMVAAHLSLDASTASRLLGECARLGLVERSHDEQDRRRTLLRLSARGDQVAAVASGLRHRMLASLLADWSEQDLREFVDRFEQLAERIGDVVATLLRGEVPASLASALADLSVEDAELLRHDVP